MKEIEELSKLLDPNDVGNLGKELALVIQKKLKKVGFIFVFLRG